MSLQSVLLAVFRHQVLVVDDVLATGRTPCEVLRLMGEAGAGPENVSVMVVAEFPVHYG